MAKRFLHWRWAALAFLLAACGDAPFDTVRVATFNMYVGLELEQKAKEFEQSGDVAQVAGEILAAFRASRPEARIAAAAKELAQRRPDFIALQEAVSFTVTPFYAIDFIAALVEAIRQAGGPEYAVLSVDNLTLSEPIQSGGIALMVGQFKDREAILYRKDFELQGTPLRQPLAAHRPPIPYGGKELVFTRSLLGGRFAARGQQPLTLFATHLDQANLGTVQSDQAAEILTTLQPYLDDENLVLVGDFNSSEGETTYALIPPFGLSDTFRLLHPADPGFTCCSASDLSNPAPIATSRIDLIFSRSRRWQAASSEIILNSREALWPSDHFGVMTVFRRPPEP